MFEWLFGKSRLRNEVNDLKARLRDLNIQWEYTKGKLATLEKRLYVLTDLLAGRTVRFVRLARDAFAAEEVVGVVEQVCKGGEVVVRDNAGKRHRTHILDVTDVFHEAKLP